MSETVPPTARSPVPLTDVLVPAELAPGVNGIMMMIGRSERICVSAGPAAVHHAATSAATRRSVPDIWAPPGNGGLSHERNRTILP